MAEKTKITWDRIDIEMENFVLNLLVKLSRPIIDSIIYSSLVPQIEDALTARVAKLNGMLENEDPFDFELPIYGNKLHLNLTMTTAPKVLYEGDLMELSVDGEFNMPQSEGNEPRFVKDDDIVEYPPRL